MTMREAEQSILTDLELLADGLNRVEYILGCARIAPGIPPEERRESDLVADCQTDTWLMTDWKDDILTLHTDSESFLVKGALFLIGEIYNGHSRWEVEGFSCTLLSSECFAGLFNSEQKKGLGYVLNDLKGGCA